MNEVIIREFQNEIANEEDLLLLAEEERQLQYLADLDYCRKIK
jgi:hypothetical protein